MDPYFKATVMAKTPEPQRLVWRAMHQDYSEDFVSDEVAPPEQQAGLIAVKRLLAGNRGHFGCLEHPAISFNLGWFPHSVMQQARTHRISVSFDVQSGRYTAQRIVDVVTGKRNVHEVFYLRPVGTYHDRQGKTYKYTEEQRKIDEIICIDSAARFKLALDKGFAEEHARDILNAYALRQHFVMTCNLRSVLHFMDLRAKRDAQLEIQQMCELMWKHVEEWVPEIAEWYTANRMFKARLAP